MCEARLKRYHKVLVISERTYMVIDTPTLVAVCVALKRSELSVIKTFGSVSIRDCNWQVNLLRRRNQSESLSPTRYSKATNIFVTI